MNKIQYANFRTLLDSNANSTGIEKKATTLDLSSGMWPLTVATKEGFAGVRRMKEELSSKMDLDARRAVNKVLQENPIVNPKEEEYLEEIRAYVRNEVKGVFHR